MESLKISESRAIPAAILLLILLPVILAAPAAAALTKEQILEQIRIPRGSTICPACPACQDPEPCPACLMPDEIHLWTYQVMILDGIDQNYVKRALFWVPNIFGYMIVPDDPGRYSVDEYGNPVPNKGEKYLILLYDITARDARVSYDPGAVWNLGGQGRGSAIWIGVRPEKITDLALGRLIMHECTHNLAPPGTYGLDKSGFPNIDKIGGPDYGSVYESWKLHNGLEIMNKLFFAMDRYWKLEDPAFGGVP